MKFLKDFMAKKLHEVALAHSLLGLWHTKKILPLSSLDTASQSESIVKRQKAILLEIEALYLKYKLFLPNVKNKKTRLNEETTKLDATVVSDFIQRKSAKSKPDKSCLLFLVACYYHMNSEPFTACNAYKESEIPYNIFTHFLRQLEAIQQGSSPSVNMADKAKQQDDITMGLAAIRKLTRLDNLITPFLQSKFPPGTFYHYICYRMGDLNTSDKDRGVKEFLHTSYLQVERRPTSEVVWFRHFYRDNTKMVRRTDGFVLELEKSMYLIGPSSNLNNNILSQPIGLKLLTAQSGSWVTDSGITSLLISSHNRSYRPLIARLAIIPVKIDLEKDRHSDNYKLGRLEHLENTNDYNKLIREHMAKYSNYTDVKRLKSIIKGSPIILEE